VEPELRELLDREQIRDLATRYSVAIDSKDIDALLQLFDPEIDNEKYGKGIAGVRAYYARFTEREGDGRGLHFVANHQIDFIDAEHATGIVYVRAFAGGDGRWVDIPAIYLDEYVKRAGHWLFSLRVPAELQRMSFEQPENRGYQSLAEGWKLHRSRGGMSQGSRAWDPDLTEPKQPFWDPVVKENIMYSGHLNRTVALAAYLMDTDQYDDVGAIRFNGFQSNGFGPRAVEYGLESLNDIIYWQLVENGFMGVACMPNSVFVSCSQFPIWGFRWQDFRVGTNRAEEIHANNQKAWNRYGGFRPGVETPFWWRAKQKDLAEMSALVAVDPAARVSGDASPSAPGAPIMASIWAYWSMTPSAYEYVESVYPTAAAAMYTRDDDGGLLVLTEREMANGGTERLGRGTAVLRGEEVPSIDKYSHFDLRHAGNWGRVALLMAEMGDPNTADLLACADEHMNPAWEDGGYYYPRSESCWKDGRFVGVSPTSGNAQIPYARLSHKAALREMYNKPWGPEHFAEPNLGDVSRDVDVTRARYFADRKALLLTLRPPHGAASVEARLELANVARGGPAWTVEIDGLELARGRTGAVETGSSDRARFEADRLIVDTPVERSTDVVVLWS
jgi:hypothetical protein